MWLLLVLVLLFHAPSPPSSHSRKKQEGIIDQVKTHHGRRKPGGKDGVVSNYMGVCWDRCGVSRNARGVAKKWCVVDALPPCHRIHTHHPHFPRPLSPGHTQTIAQTKNGWRSCV